MPMSGGSIFSFFGESWFLLPKWEILKITSELLHGFFRRRYGHFSVFEYGKGSFSVKNCLRIALRLFQTEIRLLLGFGVAKVGFQVTEICFCQVFSGTFFPASAILVRFSRKSGN